MNKVFISLLFALFALNACVRSNTPEYTAKRFCSFTRSVHFDAPTEILTAELNKEITIAKEKNAKIVEGAPDEKPPLGDGIPYQAFPDIAPVCEIGVAITNQNTSTIEIKHVFPDEPKANWSDYLVLKHVGRDWKIDDILYRTPDSKESLRASLIAVFE